MPTQAYITFPDESPDKANQLAESLAAELRRVYKDGDPKSAEVVRVDPTRQDFGTTLVLLLGTPVLLVLANAVRDWAKQKDHGTIRINGIKINNVASKDVAEIIGPQPPTAAQPTNPVERQRADPNCRKDDRDLFRSESLSVLRGPRFFGCV